MPQLNKGITPDSKASYSGESYSEPDINWDDIYKRENERLQKEAASNQALNTLLLEFADLHERYKEEKAKYTEIESRYKSLEEEVLQHLENAGLTGVECNGKKFKRIETNCSYPVPGSENAVFNWLREEGYGEKIKKAKETIHPRTLYKIMDEAKQQGLEIPEHTTKTTPRISVSKA